MPGRTPLRALVAGLTLTTGALLLSPLPASAAAQTKSIPVGDHPYDVALAQSLGEAFVVDQDSVTVVSLLTQRPLATIPTQGTNQNAIALVRSSTHAYVTDFDSANLVDVDTELRQVARRIDVGKGAVDVAKVNTPKGQRAYVARRDAKQVVVVQTSSSKVVSRITVPGNPETVTAAPGGKDVWVGSGNEGRVWVVDTSTGKVRKTIKITKVGPVASVAFAPDGKHAAVTGPGGLGVVRASKGALAAFVPTPSLFPHSPGPNPGPVAYNGSGSRLLAVDSTFPDVPQQGSVAVVETKHYRVKDQVPTGVEPVGLAVDTKRDVAYTANYGDDTITSYYP